MIVLAQGLVGYLQYATDLPVALVAAHVLGACLVWVAALRLVLGMSVRVAAASSRRAQHEEATRLPRPSLTRRCRRTLRRPTAGVAAAVAATAAAASAAAAVVQRRTSAARQRATALTSTPRSPLR